MALFGRETDQIRLERLEHQVAQLQSQVDLLTRQLGSTGPGAVTPAADGGALQPVPDRVRELIAAGKKVQAIKELREHTGMGLVAAKQEVDRMERYR